MGNSSNVRHVFSKVVGISRPNRDGSSRQDIAAKCQTLEKLVLRHEEDNPVDPNAVAVLRETGEQLGYLRAELAKEVVQNAGQGYSYGVNVAEVTGGGRGEYLGVNLLIVITKPGVGSREAQRYVDALDLSGEVLEREEGEYPFAAQKTKPQSQGGCVLFLCFVLLGLLLVFGLWAFS